MKNDIPKRVEKRGNEIRARIQQNPGGVVIDDAKLMTEKGVG